MSKRKSKYTFIFVSYLELEPKYCVRISPLETDDFPFGLSLSNGFSTKEDAERFADKVDAYLEKAFVKKE